VVHFEVTGDNLDAKHVKAIRDCLDLFIRRTSDEFDICEEAVAAIAFYWLQRHPTWGRNATTAQKNASYKHWNGTCHRCKKPVGRAEAKFHHLSRGIPRQHQPLNLVPEHTSCHDDEHNVIYASLAKGSPQPRKPKKTSISDG
jgi:hypothetical protein